MIPYFLLIALSLSVSGYAAYGRANNELDDLKHMVQNHEAELHTFEEKTRTFEELIDSLRQQQNDTLQAMRESLKNLDAKISAQESAAKSLTTALQGHATDSVVALSDYKKRIQELEKTIDQQNRNIANLQTAFKSLAEAIASGKDAPLEEATGDKVYRVKPGDSLGKIASQNKTTVKKIKELNNLTSDQILVGQKLRLPDP